MTPSREDAIKFAEALTDARLDYAGMSWSGFNLFGNPASIREALRMRHEAMALPSIRGDLLARIKQLQDDFATSERLRVHAERELAKDSALVNQLQAALKPFADECDLIMQDETEWPHDRPIYSGGRVTISDYRVAREAIAGTKGASATDND